MHRGPPSCRTVTSSGTAHTPGRHRSSHATRQVRANRPWEACHTEPGRRRTQVCRYCLPCACDTECGWPSPLAVGCSLSLALLAPTFLVTLAFAVQDWRKTV